METKQKNTNILLYVVVLGKLLKAILAENWISQEKMTFRLSPCPIKLNDYNLMFFFYKEPLNKEPTG